MTEVIAEREEKTDKEVSELERRLLYLLENSEFLSKINPQKYLVVLEKVFNNYFAHPRRQGDIRQYEQTYEGVRNSLARV